MAINQVTKGRARVNRLVVMDGVHVGEGELVQKTYRIRLVATDGTEQDTGVDLPSDGRVTDVRLNVITAEATGTTKTLDVGLLSSETNGDANGFLAAVDVSATGWVQGSLASGAQTLGALLSVDEDGAGTLVPEAHIIDTAVSVSHTAGDVDWVEFVGDLFITVEFPDDTSTS